MNKRYALSITLIVISASMLIACQPETTVQERPSPTTDLPKLPTVAVVTDSVQTNTPAPVEPTLVPESDERATADPGFGEGEARIPANETPFPFVEIPPSAEELVSLAKSDLAEQLGVPEYDIALESVVVVVWPDGSLGCPQPGLEYVQVLTPGYQILLSYQGVESEYHSDGNSTVVKCVGDFLKPLPTMPFDPGEIKDGEPWMPVD